MVGKVGRVIINKSVCGAEAGNGLRKYVLLLPIPYVCTYVYAKPSSGQAREDRRIGRSMSAKVEDGLRLYGKRIERKGRGLVGGWSGVGIGSLEDEMMSMERNAVFTYCLLIQPFTIRLCIWPKEKTRVKAAFYS